MHGDRNKAVQLLDRWLADDIMNSEFDDEWPYSSEDRAVVDIGRELWLHYSDSPKTRLKASDLSTEELQLLNRCLAFLITSEDYEPVATEEAVRWKRGFLAKLFGAPMRPWETLRLKISPDRQKWWPFADEAQYRRVMRSD